MAWFTRFTRFADVHLVYAQEKENSCGIACMMMAVFKINKLKPGTKALHAEEQIYKVYGEVSGSEYDGTDYTYASYLAATLNRLNVGIWKAANVGAASVTKKIIDRVGTASGVGPIVSVKPAIVLVGWTDAGAHFVVVDTVRSFAGKLYATACDPWDGNVHVTEIKKGAPFTYKGAPVPLSWDLGGTHHEYGKKTGAPNGWMIYRKS